MAEQLPGLVDSDGIYRSKVLPGFWLRVEWLWAEDPNLLQALAQVIGPDRLADALRLYHPQS